MFKYKKGQNITNPFVIVIVLLIVSAISTTLWSFGKDLAENPNNNLNEESLGAIYNKSGFVLNTTIDDVNETKNLFYSSETDTQSNLKDYALEFQFFREQSSPIRSYIQDLWNLPTFFVDNLGLDGEAWQPLVQMFNLVIWVIIFYVIYRILRGLI